MKLQIEQEKKDEEAEAAVSSHNDTFAHLNKIFNQEPITLFTLT